MSYHINNIYKQKELEERSTVKISLIVQNEGGRQISREITYYNLDMICICIY